MSIDPNKPIDPIKCTFEALEQFNAYSAQPNEEKKVLKVCESSDGRYLKLMPKTNMSFWQRFKSIFGRSSFNLKNVLDVVEAAAELKQTAGSTETVQNRYKILENAAKNLKDNVNTHYKGHPQEEIKTKIENIINLIMVKPETPKAAPVKQTPLSQEDLSKLKQTLNEEAQKQNIKTGPFRDSRGAAFDQLRSIWAEALIDTGIGERVAKMLNEGAGAEKILKVIVERLEKGDEDPRFKQMGVALKEACEVLIKEADENKIPPKDRHFNDPVSFTVSVFVFRTVASMILAAALRPSEATSLLNENVEKATAYIHGEATDLTPLFDRLAVVLTGSTPER